MKKIQLLVMLVFLLVLSPNIFAQTQLNMNKDAADSYKKVDQELNTVYTQVLKLYASDAPFVLHLKAAERAWVQFRNEQVKMKYTPENNYGSARPMCVSVYMEELTNDRIKTLKVWVDGQEEGDVCNGSVHTKN